MGLRWQDVDAREGLIRVRVQRDRKTGALVAPKTRAAKRDVPVPPSLGRMLAELRLASVYSADSDFVFASAEGTPLGIRNIIRRGLEPVAATERCKARPDTPDSSSGADRPESA